MKVLYDEDLASHIGPKPCVVSREGQGEASAGDRAGWPSSRESASSRVPTVLPDWKATRAAALTVSAVAEECKISNIKVGLYQEESFHEVYSRFSVAVQGAIARIRVLGRGFRHPYSVQLGPNTRTKIEHYILRIRGTIDKSDLAPDRRKALGAKLDELVAELANRRVGFGKTMAVLGAVLLGLGSATTIAADGPVAVNNTMKLLAADKETEDAARLRLAPPQKALPMPPAKTADLPVAVAPVGMPRPTATWTTRSHYATERPSYVFGMEPRTE